jgi:hypothetical protein
MGQNRTSYALLLKRAMRHEPPDYSGSPTAGASDAYSKHIQELGPALLSMTLSRVARFRARSRIARCEVRYNREKVLLVEIGYDLGH